MNRARIMNVALRKVNEIEDVGLSLCEFADEYDYDELEELREKMEFHKVSITLVELQDLWSVSHGFIKIEVKQAVRAFKQ